MGVRGLASSCPRACWGEDGEFLAELPEPTSGDYRQYSPSRGEAPARHKAYGGAPSSSHRRWQGSGIGGRVKAPGRRPSGRRPAKSRAPRRAWFLTWRTSGPSADTIGTRCRARAEPPSANARPWPADAAPGRIGPAGTTSAATCKCGNSPLGGMASRRAGWWPAGKSHRTYPAGICPGDRLANTFHRLESCVLCDNQPAAARCVAYASRQLSKPTGTCMHLLSEWKQLWPAPGRLAVLRPGPARNLAIVLLGLLVSSADRA